MKSKTAKKKVSEKGFFRKAGEVIGSIGHELAGGKDKVISASHNIIDSIAAQASQLKKKPVKKAAVKLAKKKSAAVKKSADKAEKQVKKTALKVVRKVAKKAKKIAAKKK